jgi:anti-sigma factor RsiW
MERMMTCRELMDFLGDYVAGTLETQERTAFEGHLAGCPACIDYVRSYRETIRLTKGSLAPVGDADGAIPTELVDAILDATRRRRDR